MSQPLAGELAPQWFEVQGTSLARLGRRRQLKNLVDRWAKINAPLAHGFYGWILSNTQQGDPGGRSSAELMREAIDAGDRLHDDDLLRRIWVRYIGNLAINGQVTEALRFYDLAVARFGSAGHLDRADLARTAAAGGDGEMARARQHRPGRAAGQGSRARHGPAHLGTGDGAARPALRAARRR